MRFMDVIPELLNHGALPNIGNDFELTPLMLATKMGNLELVLMLLKHGVMVDIKDENGITAFMYAVRLRHREIALALLDHGADAYIKDKKGNTAMTIAAKKGHHDMLKSLLDHGVTTKGWGEDALLKSIPNNQVNVVSTLLDLDVNPSGYADMFLPSTAIMPLEAAIEAGNMKIASLLLEKGACLKSKDLYYGYHKQMPPLIAAVKNGNTELVHTLLDLKADPNHPDNYTALTTAVDDQRLDLVELLLENRANPNVNTLQNNFNGVSVGIVSRLLEHGADSNHLFKNVVDFPYIHEGEASSDIKEIVEILIKHGADVNYRNAKGDTALFIAIQFGFKEVTETLIQNNADVNIPNNQGTTAVAYAAKLGDEAIVQYLIESGANINIQDKAGRNALYYAANPDIAHILLLHDPSTAEEAAEERGL